MFVTTSDSLFHQIYNECMTELKKISLSELDASIIRYLISCQDYCTSYDIAMNVGINRRQIRSEINVIKDILEDLGYTLDSKRSKGYFILERSELGFLNELVNNAGTHNEFLSPGVRRTYATQLLIENDDDYMRLDDLADALYVSRSTINNDLAQHLSRLEKHNLTLDFKKRGGVRIVGTELAKRESYCDGLFSIFSNSRTIYNYLDLFTNPQAKLENMIVDTLQAYSIQMSDTAMCDFLIYLTVLASRISKGKTLTESPDITPIEGRSEFDVARILAGLLSNYLNVQINEHEINRIAIKLLAKRSSTLITDATEHPEALLISRDCLDQIYKTMRISFHDPRFARIFEQYIYTTYVITRYNEKVRHPLYQEMQENYPVAYDMAKIVSDVFRQHTGTPLSSSHIAFYTTFFNTWISRMKTKKEPVLLICSLGTGATESVREQLMVDLGSRIDILDTCMYYQLNDMDLSRYTFIISTMPINRTLSIPTVHISQFVLQDDIKKIIDFLSTNFSSFRPLCVMTPSLYIDRVHASDINGAYSAMAKIISSVFKKLKPTYVESILSTEQNIINVLPNSIALIKLSKPLSSHSFISVLALDQPLLYNGEEIRILLAVSSVNKTINLFTAMQEKCVSVRKKDICSFIEQPHEYHEFLSLVTDIEKEDSDF